MDGKNLDGRKTHYIGFRRQKLQSIIDASIMHKRFVDSFEKQCFVISEKRWLEMGQEVNP